MLAYVRVYSGPVSMRHRSGEINYLYGRCERSANVAGSSCGTTFANGYQLFP